jgi:hypothetical protein
MSKLTIEDIMPYIPFGLKAIVKEKPDEIWTVEGKNIDGLLEMSLDENTTAMASIDNIIPILYPMDLLDKPIIFNKKEIILTKAMREPVAARGGTAQFHTDAVHTPMSHFGDVFPYTFMDEVLTWLWKYKFDYKDLIIKGLAIAAKNEYE